MPRKLLWPARRPLPKNRYKVPLMKALVRRTLLSMA